LSTNYLTSTGMTDEYWYVGGKEMAIRVVIVICE